MTGGLPKQNKQYAEAVGEFGDALVRLARGYESNAERRRDLLQEIHVALWKSFEGFNSQCSLRTWVFQVAHNAGASHILRERRARVGQWVDLDHAQFVSGGQDVEAFVCAGQLSRACQHTDFIQIGKVRRFDRTG